MKSTLYITTQVQPGNRIEIQAPALSVEQPVEVVILIGEEDISSSVGVYKLSLEQRRAFLKLPIAERRRILAEQAEAMLTHYQQEYKMARVDGR